MSRLGPSAHTMKLKSMLKLSRKETKEDHDSADELEDVGTEDNNLFQKVPESLVNMNMHLLSLKSPGRENSSMISPLGSPMKEMSVNINSQFKSPREQEESLKRMMYNLSPREAAEEYLRRSQNAAKKEVHKDTKRKSTSPPQSSRKYPYAFNQSYQSNQENSARNLAVNGSLDQQLHSASHHIPNQVSNQKFLNHSQSRKSNLGVADSPNLLYGEINDHKARSVSRQSQEALTNRLVKEAEIKNEHRKYLADSYISKEMSECTFSPRISNDKSRRNLGQFLEDQKNFQLQAQMKKKKLQEHLLSAKSLEEGPYKPQINQNSARMVKNKKEESLAAHERLYQLNNSVHVKLLQDRSAQGESIIHKNLYDSQDFIGTLNGNGSLLHDKEEPTFRPNIQNRSKNMKRSERVEKVLYDDAMRRQKKALEPKGQTRAASTKTMSKTTKKANAKRFIKEFDMAIMDFLEEGREPVLNYIQLNEFLRRLQFLKVSEQIDNPVFASERLLLQDVWNMLTGDKYKGVHRRNLLVFLLSVLNLHFPITRIPKVHHINLSSSLKYGSEAWSSQLKGSASSKEQKKEVGYLDEDENYIISEEEVKKVHKKFELLYINRLHSADNIGKLITSRNFEEYKHHPETNKSSKNLAQNYREKILEGASELLEQNKIPVPKDGKLSHADLLIVTKKLAEEKLIRYEDSLREDEAKNCTFRPQINNNYHHGLSKNGSDVDLQSKRSPRSSVTAPGTDRGHDLYGLAKPSALKRNKDASEVEYEKNQEHCTFQPFLYAKRNSASNIAADAVPKGAEKAVERLRYAQVEKDVQKSKMQRGFSTGSEKNFNFTLDSNTFTKKTSLGKNNHFGNQTHGSTKLHQEKLSPKGHLFHEDVQHKPTQNRSSEHHNLHSKQDRYSSNTYSMEHNYDSKDASVNEYESDNQIDDKYHSRNPGEGKHFIHEEEERVPLLFVDVNLGQGRAEKIVVYEGDTAEKLAQEFTNEHGLDPSMQIKLKALLEAQIAGLLTKIDEEVNSAYSDTDRHGHENSY